MPGKIRLLALYVILVILTSLNIPSSVAAADAVEKELHQIFEDYFEAILELNPVYASFIGDNRFNDRFANSIGPEYIKKSDALEREYLAKIQSIDPAQLKGQDLLSYEIFKRDREESIEGSKFPGELLPINQSFSTPNFFAQLGSGKSAHPFKTVQDYENFLKRINGFVKWMNQAVVNMKEGVSRGYVQPTILMEKSLPQLQAHVVDDPEQSIFWGPIQEMPEDFNQEDRDRLTEAYREAIMKKLVPAYRSVHDYIEKEYMPHTRSRVGMDALPNGKEWYAFQVKSYTTTNLTPDEIHQIGLSEVARIHEEMRKVQKQVGVEGDLQAFFKFMNDDPRFYFKNRDDLLNGYRDLKKRVDPLLPKLFDIMPEQDYEVRPVEEFREKSASGASYMSATPDGSRPGVFYVNTYDLTARPIWAMESLSLHEAAPGHHFQISIQQSLEELPRFRRFGGYGAYVEGWGLYAESLGKELGVYTDPYQYFGMLNAELWRAIRLVVDTGIHSKGWTREDVLKYMYDNSPVKEARAVSEAERYIAAPGQALGYKIGQLKIRELRTRAEKALGSKFDVRKFHNEILTDGSLPLDVLERKIDRWIAAPKS